MPTIVIARQTSFSHTERGNPLGKILTLGFGFRDEDKYRTEERPVIEYEVEEQTKKVQVPQTAHCQAYRNVTKYRTRQRLVTKTVEYQLDLEHFFPRALAEISAEMRQALAQ